MRGRTNTLVVLIAGAVISLLASPLSAQEAASGETKPAQTLETVTVTGERDAYKTDKAMTATKTDTPLKDIAQTINVVPLQELRDRGVIKITDVFNTVPGAQATTGYGGLGSGHGAILRGFFSNGDYRDGFRDFGFVSPRDIAVFERVEILKGPASVLYGTNDPGGVVNYVSKRPQFTGAREVALSFGSYNARRAEVDLTGPFGEGSAFAYRIVAATDDRDSHRDFVSSKTRVIAPSLTWMRSTALGKRLITGEANSVK